MPEQTTISVNGEPRQVQANTPLTQILVDFKIDPASARGIAVAINDEIIRRKAWEDQKLAEGDRIEIVTARQGG